MAGITYSYVIHSSLSTCRGGSGRHAKAACVLLSSSSFLQPHQLLADTHTQGRPRRCDCQCSPARRGRDAMYTIASRHLFGACLFTTYALAMLYALYRHGGLWPVTSVRLFFACQFCYSALRASYSFANPDGTSANMNDRSQDTDDFLGGLSFCFSTAFMHRPVRTPHR